MALEIRKGITIKGYTLSEDPILYFDNIGTAPSLAAITVDSFGGGNTGELIIQNSQSGTLTQALRIGQTGSVYIGTGTIDPSAILQIDSLIDGFLPPRNPDPATNITLPARGLMAYDDTDDELQYYNGTSWVSLTSSTGFFLPLAGGTMVNGAEINLYNDSGDIAKIFGTNAHSGVSDIEITSDNGLLKVSTDSGIIVDNGIFSHNNTSLIAIQPNGIGFIGNLYVPTITAARSWALPDETGTIALTSQISSQDLQGVMGLGSTATGLLTSVEISTSADVNISAAGSMITLDAMDINVGNTGSVTNTYVKANDLVEIESSIAVNIVATGQLDIQSTAADVSMSAFSDLSLAASDRATLTTNTGLLHIVSANDNIKLETQGTGTNADITIQCDSLSGGATSASIKLPGTGDIGTPATGYVLTAASANGELRWTRPVYSVTEVTTTTTTVNDKIMKCGGGDTLTIDDTVASIGTEFIITKQTGGTVTINLTGTQVGLSFAVTSTNTGGLTTYAWNPGTYGYAIMTKLDAGFWILKDN